MLDKNQTLDSWWVGKVLVFEFPKVRPRREETERTWVPDQVGDKLAGEEACNENVSWIVENTSRIFFVLKPYRRRVLYKNMP